MPAPVRSSRSVPRSTGASWARCPRPAPRTRSPPERRRSGARRSGDVPRPMSGCGSSSRPPSSPTSAPRPSPRSSAPRTARRSPRRRPRPAAPGAPRAEKGRPLTEATAEAGRSGDLIRLSAFEGTQLYGDTLPLDANKGTGLDKIGFTVRQPVGVVVAITPFNYPSLLVLHKIAPALAAGNAVVLKPARTTPLTALALAECFVDAGLPEGVLSVLTGPGGSLGDLLVSDPRVRKVSFTGSTGIGERITARAGVKHLSLELGASCPVVILPDADIDAAAAAVALGGFVNAGQVCISVQRVITHPTIAGDFLDALVPRVQKISTGDPGSTDT